MAVVNGYSSLAKFKAQYLANPAPPTNAANDTLIEDYITAASRWIDNEVFPRTFYARTETHYFDLDEVADGGRTIFFNDYLLSATTLTNGDATTISASSYVLYPVTERGTSSVEVPNYKLTIRPSASLTFVSADGDIERCISLSGSWGWSSTTPADIEQACLEISHNAYRRKTGQGETVSTITAGGVMIAPRDISEFAKTVLYRYAHGLGIT